LRVPLQLFSILVVRLSVHVAVHPSEIPLMLSDYRRVINATSNTQWIRTCASTSSSSSSYQMVQGTHTAAKHSTPTPVSLSPRPQNMKTLDPYALSNPKPETRNPKSDLTPWSILNLNPTLNIHPKPETRNPKPDLIPCTTSCQCTPCGPQRLSGPCGKQSSESPALAFIGCSGRILSVGTSSSETDPTGCSWTAESFPKKDSWPTQNHTLTGMPRLVPPSTTMFVDSSKRSSKDRIGLGRAGKSSRLPGKLNSNKPNQSVSRDSLVNFLLGLQVGVSPAVPVHPWISTRRAAKLLKYRYVVLLACYTAVTLL
jgi:hypothetical protein